MKQFSKFASGFVIGVVSVAICADTLHSALFANEPPPAISVDATPINRSTSGITSFAPIVKKAAPSVVNIYSSHVIHYRQYNPFLNDPLLRQFFGDRGDDQGSDNHRRTRREQILGSGVIISPDGYILTANHVVEGGDEIKIAAPGSKTEYTAKVIGTEPP